MEHSFKVELNPDWEPTSDVPATKYGDASYKGEYNVGNPKKGR
jgi:hypothetical protein